MSDTPSSDSLPCGFCLLNYTIMKVLGRGGFGVTYLAHDNDNNIDVVIKENMPAQCSTRDATTSQVIPLSGQRMEDLYTWALKSFVKEALTLKELDHPNIIRGIELIEGGGTAYYVMHRVQGEDVVSTVQQRGGADEAFLTALTIKVLDALSYLHGKNVLHRDIKPANILIRKDGEPVLIDFGAARKMTTAGRQTVVQSAGYTPIEQRQQEGKTGPWTDLYALGATLYELITGERPPDCIDRMGDDTWVPLSRQETLLSTYSLSFLSSIDRALALWPQNRWQQAEEWKQALLHPAPPVVPAPPQPAPTVVATIGEPSMVQPPPPVEAQPPTSLFCPACRKAWEGEETPSVCPHCAHPIRPDKEGVKALYLFAVQKKYACFCGRATSKEFLTVIIGNLLLCCACSIVSEHLVWLPFFGLLLPGLAVFARRMHDIGRSGKGMWWFVAWFVCFAYVGESDESSALETPAALVFLVSSGVLLYDSWLLITRAGDTGNNRFGPPVTGPRR